MLANNKPITAYLSLFTSSATLVCCAIPSLLVALGMGATLVSVTSAIPQLILLSTYKSYVFTVAGVMISVAIWMHYRSRHESCPIDPRQAAACGRSRAISKYVLFFSGAVYLVGAFFAFVAPYVLT